MYNLQFIVASCLLCATDIICQAKTIKKGDAFLLKPYQELDSWKGKYFPYAPGEPHVKKVQRVQLSPNAISKTEDTWKGPWFPYAPGVPHSTPKIESAEEMGHRICDDGMINLKMDYDPEDVRQNFNYLCLTSNRSVFDPNMNTEALLTEHFLPSAYEPASKCLNESISYTHQPPTNGPFRPVPAVYGSYKYLPPQRYVRNLAEGAIVMLYHPCVYHGQLKELQDIVNGCLYRHLITPSLSLSPKRPLVVLGWSRSLSMSVVDKKLVAGFIKQNAKIGPLAMQNLSRVVEKRETYKAGLLSEAHLVTDLDDTELCGYLEQHM
ncbi:CG12093 [Drosophila busckii]|uniref:CG12093 n=1 Tax=Drosophila busckii TaxID=30019 RepID=A0A0M3QW68_DROBS|nr:CG12093 [Drosophila busckii]